MLRHHAVFDGLAANFAAVTLLGAEPLPAIRRVLDGDDLVSV